MSNLRNRNYLSERSSGRGAILDGYIKGDITLAQLVKKAGGLKNIAEKKELEAFLRNSFMISMKADDAMVSEKKVIAKVKALLKRY